MLETFVQVLRDRYEITGKDGQAVSAEELQGVVTTFETYHKKKCDELKRDCQSRELVSSGTKDQMVLRLLGVVEEISEVPKVSAPKPKRRRQSAKKQKDNVLDKLKASAPLVRVRRNKFNNFELADTGLVLNEESRQIIGRQDGSGRVHPLTAEDIEYCQDNMIAYLLPANLSNGEVPAEV